jgi:hypothetical protein
MNRLRLLVLELIPSNKVFAHKDLVLDYAKRINFEKRLMLQSLQYNYIASSTTDCLSINQPIVNLHSKIADWESELASLSKSLVQSDLKENWRSQAIQIKNMFRQNNADEIAHVSGYNSNSKISSGLLGSSPPKTNFEMQSIPTNPEPIDLDFDGDDIVDTKCLEEPEPLVFGTMIQEDFDIGNNAPLSPISHISLGDEPIDDSVVPSIEPGSGINRPDIFAEDDLVGSLEMNGISGVSSSDYEMESINQIMDLTPSGGERNSIIKTLSSLWAGTMSSTSSLEYPMYVCQDLSMWMPILKLLGF